jgi:dTDP-4-amino-4,6-dideoxygalactose transaminase
VVAGKQAEYISRGQFIGGEPVVELQNRFTKALYSESKSLAVASGTDALYTSFVAAKRAAGWVEAKIVIPDYTFSATANAAVRAVGAENVIIATVNRESLMLTPDSVVCALDELYKNPQDPPPDCGVIICPVHLYGGVCDVLAIRLHLREVYPYLNVLIVEDCAQAQGSPGVGTSGEFSAYSFFPTKNFGCWGDGGLLTIRPCEHYDVAEAYDEAFRLTHQGASLELGKYNSVSIGGNSRMDTLQAIVVNEKMCVEEGIFNSKFNLMDAYCHELIEIPNVQIVTGNKSTYGIHPSLMVIRTDTFFQRDRVRKHLQEQGIGTGVYYQYGLHAQKAYEDCVQLDLPEYINSVAAGATTLAIPFYYGMMLADLMTVCEEIKKGIQNVGRFKSGRPAVHSG